MGEAAPSNPSPKSYYSMDCECRAHAAIFLARQEAACDPFSALDLSVDKFHLRQHAQHQVLTLFFLEFPLVRVRVDLYKST